MEELLQNMIVDPNIVYLGLLAGLWVGVTAAYFMGTGVPELISLVLIGAAVMALLSLPTNWIAVLLMVIGVSTFLVVPFVKPSLGQFADFGLILQALGAMTLFNGFSVSPLLVVVTIGIAWAYHRFVLLPALRSYRNRAAVTVNQESVVGARGRVLRAVNPVGTVHVQGETWTARSDETLEVGAEIIVVEQRGLELQVEKAKRPDLAEMLQSNGIHKS